MRNYFNVDAYIKQLEQSSAIAQCDKVPLPDIAKNQNYLFISYAHQDYKKVYADLAVLYHAGVRFWYDRGLVAGKNWDAEVKNIIEDPRCSGVIFFLSENMFLSRSVNQEIDLIRGNGENPGKNYFCVNLSEVLPSHILRNIMRMDDSVLDNAGLDMERIGLLANTFSDKQTYLLFSEADHRKNLLNQITVQFDVVESGEKNRGYLTNKKTGDVISITEDSFFIGRTARKCHYCIQNDDTVSTVHVCIAFDKIGGLIMDMGAINGTSVNGNRIKSMAPVRLHDQDEIAIGNQIFVFHSQ